MVSRHCTITNRLFWLSSLAHSLLLCRIPPPPDIIARSATEIVKNCFGDDPDEAKSLPWSREQAWYLVKTLSKDKEVSPGARGAQRG